MKTEPNLTRESDMAKILDALVDAMMKSAKLWKYDNDGFEAMKRVLNAAYLKATGGE